METLVVINACVREKDSRTLRIAEPIIEALSRRYEVHRYNLPQMEGIVPMNPALYAERSIGKIPAWAMAAAADGSRSFAAGSGNGTTRDRDLAARAIAAADTSSTIAACSADVPALDDDVATS